MIFAFIEQITIASKNENANLISPSEAASPSTSYNVAAQTSSSSRESHQKEVNSGIEDFEEDSDCSVKDRDYVPDMEAELSNNST